MQELRYRILTEAVYNFSFKTCNTHIIQIGFVSLVSLRTPTSQKETFGQNQHLLAPDRKETCPLIISQFLVIKIHNCDPGAAGGVHTTATPACTYIVQLFSIVRHTHSSQSVHITHKVYIIHAQYAPIRMHSNQSVHSTHSSTIFIVHTQYTICMILHST